MSGIPQQLPETGLLNLFVQHTSCALTINENADPDVRGDMARIMDCLVCEGEPYYEHTLEGLDDMPAHAKSSLFGGALRFQSPHIALLSARGKVSTSANSAIPAAAEASWLP